MTWHAEPSVQFDYSQFDPEPEHAHDGADIVKKILVFLVESKTPKLDITDSCQWKVFSRPAIDEGIVSNSQNSYLLSSGRTEFSVWLFPRNSGGNSGGIISSKVDRLRSN